MTAFTQEDDMIHETIEIMEQQGVSFRDAAEVIVKKYAPQGMSAAEHGVAIAELAHVAHSRRVFGMAWASILGNAQRRVADRHRRLRV